MKILKDKQKERSILGCLIVIVTVIRIVMMSKEAIYIENSPHDDNLMIKLAMSIYRGEWLGDYSQYTLLKGVAFPLFLDIIHFLGIPYIVAITLLYIGACFIFVYAMKPVIHSDWLRFIIYCAQLFNPGLSSPGGAQRIYLTTIVAPEVLIVFAGFFSMYSYHDQRKELLKWALLTGITLAIMWQTKDDSIWIIPFAIVATVIIVLSVRVCKIPLKEKCFLY